MMSKMHKMTDDELLDELDQQSEWSKDDSFEYTAFGRGDNGFERDNYIGELYAEAVRRGLREPLPQAPEDDSDFEAIKTYMEAKGYEWYQGNFRQWGDIAGLPGKRQVGFCNFEDAAAKWHAQYVDEAQRINHSEMWRE